MLLTLTNPDSGGVVRVACVGQISQSRFAGSADPMLALLGPEGLKRKVHFDLNDVEYIDSSGIGWLVGSHRRFTEAGGELILCRVPPVVDQVLRFCGLENFFHIQPDS